MQAGIGHCSGAKRALFGQKLDGPSDPGIDCVQYRDDPGGGESRVPAGDLPHCGTDPIQVV